jgi:hypothetical protein
MKRSLWPYAIIIAFIVFISGTVGLVVLACSQKVDLVSANYYEQEIKFQSHLDRLHRTQRLGAHASVSYDAQAQRITVWLPPGQVQPAVSGWIQLYRPSSARLDRALKLSLASDGTQTIDASPLSAGLWKIRVCWQVAPQSQEGEQSVENSDTDFFIDQRLIIKPAHETPRS